MDGNAWQDRSRSSPARRAASAGRSRWALAQDGATVIGTATTDEGAAKIGACLKEAGNAGTGMRLDVSDGAAVDATIGAIEASFGAVTILVNNAGITRDNLLLRMKEEEWDAIMATNLKPAYRLAKAVLRGMMKARPAGSSRSDRWWARAAIRGRSTTRRPRRR